jgi:hypothetical protein
LHEAVFGDFPHTKEVERFKKAFASVCEPETFAPTAENCAKIREFITKNFRPLPNNKHGVMITTTLEFGRSINSATKDDLLATHLKALPAESATRKDWHDPIWRTDWRNAGIQPRRAKIVGR